MVTRWIQLCLMLSLQTTDRYTKVEMADLRGVIDRCHPREKQGP